MSGHAVLVTVSDRPGMLFGMTGVLANHQANITYVDMHGGGALSDTYFEFTLPDDAVFETVLRDLRAVDGVIRVEETPSLIKIYGKRIIVMGGGAQVGQVALGAIAEADRHNIRGERISVDTIPLVGEQELAAAVPRRGPPAARQAARPGGLANGRCDLPGGRGSSEERP